MCFRCSCSYILIGRHRLLPVGGADPTNTAAASFRHGRPPGERAGGSKRRQVAQIRCTIAREQDLNQQGAAGRWLRLLPAWCPCPSRAIGRQALRAPATPQPHFQTSVVLPLMSLLAVHCRRQSCWHDAAAVWHLCIMHPMIRLRRLWLHRHHAPAPARWGRGGLPARQVLARAACRSAEYACLMESTSVEL